VTRKVKTQHFSVYSYNEHISGRIRKMQCSPVLSSCIISADCEVKRRVTWTKKN